MVRFCAGTGRMRNPGNALVLERSLANVPSSGKAIEWYAVRRRFNKAADALATQGVLEAGVRLSNNNLTPLITTIFNTTGVRLHD